PGTYDFGYVVNKNNQIMDGGDSLKAAAWYQEMIIVPDPGNINRFYLFTAGVTSTPIPGFYYSVIDLSYNGGLGRVVQKNIRLQSFPVCDGLAAVKHGNGRDWWVFLQHWDGNGTTQNDEYYSYLITPSGITGPFIQHIGTFTNGGFNRLKFTRDGSKLFVVNPANLIESYDFNRCTGLLSNLNTIEPQGSAQPYTNYWHFAISPNATKLYVSSIMNGANQDTSYLFQFDLTASNILGSKTTLFSCVNPLQAGLLQPGPDGKIYFSCCLAVYDCEFDYLFCDTTYYPENMNISVINQPDSLGAACNFQPFSFYLGGHRAYYGLPNNPNYELGPDTNSFCDTVLAVSNVLPVVGKEELFVFYHPLWQTAFINAKGLIGKNYELQICDVLGKVIYRETGKLNSEFYSKDVAMQSFSSGLYVVSLLTEREKLVRRFVKE
ncbi:MAG: T9SS type A sorting domain-containing protein, partial [Bacteroidetes bacterium]|nr:T9SS type A sorting domain-containing protein [Bacteroidota bacterium]